MSIGPTIGLFALGVKPEDYDLPHPRLGLRVILLMRRVLLRAFEQLRSDGFPFATATEDEITMALHGVLENKLRQHGIIPGFNRHFFDPVVRQAQVANYNFKRLTKTPDLHFRLRHDDQEPRRVLSAYDGLFIECKPIDATHPAGSKYCDDGLQRFVDGSYAWAMQEGMMLGYARHGRTIDKNLLPDMQAPDRQTSLKTISLPQAMPNHGTMVAAHAEALHVSSHRRGFLWIGGKGVATNIVIYHTWHDCS